MEAADTAARRHFAELIARREIPLDEAALAIAEEEYPRLPAGPYLRRIDELATRVEARLPRRRTGADALSAVRRVLFDEDGFRGNDENYYDPRNSFLNEVLDRRLGIPISLSVLFLSVARRVGLAAEGVGLPGHFLVKLAAGGREIFLDAHRNGEVFGAEECAERWRASAPGRGPFDPRWLEAVSTRQILGRMLHNLKRIYAEESDDLRTLWVIDRLLLLSPGDPAERRDRGLVAARLGGTASALADLEAYLAASPGASDAGEVKALAEQLRKRQAFLN
jgi:regulator of sirC expression with transglutaminase-like and TPR domain